MGAPDGNRPGGGPSLLCRIVRPVLPQPSRLGAGRAEQPGLVGFGSFPNRIYQPLDRRGGQAGGKPSRVGPTRRFGCGGDGMPRSPSWRRLRPTPFHSHRQPDRAQQYHSKRRLRAVWGSFERLELPAQLLSKVPGERAGNRLRVGFQLGRGGVGSGPDGIRRLSSPFAYGESPRCHRSSAGPAQRTSGKGRLFRRPSVAVPDVPPWHPVASGWVCGLAAGGTSVIPCHRPSGTSSAGNGVRPRGLLAEPASGAPHPG